MDEVFHFEQTYSEGCLISFIPDFALGIWSPNDEVVKKLQRYNVDPKSPDPGVNLVIFEKFASQNRPEASMRLAGSAPCNLLTLQYF